MSAESRVQKQRPLFWTTHRTALESPTEKEQDGESLCFGRIGLVSTCHMPCRSVPSLLSAFGCGLPSCGRQWYCLFYLPGAYSGNLPPTSARIEVCRTDLFAEKFFCTCITNDMLSTSNPARIRLRCSNSASPVSRSRPLSLISLDEVSKRTASPAAPSTTRCFKFQRVFQRFYHLPANGSHDVSVPHLADELFPIYGAAPPSSGGLGYAASTIGLLGGLTGAVLFLFTLVFLKVNPPSARACFALGTLLYLPATLLMPLTSLLTSSATWQWWAVAILLIEKNVAACMGFTGAMVLVSNSTDSSNMGAVTGFSHSIGAFARAAGPFLGGSLWSFSVALRTPLSQFIPWECITVLTIVTLILAVLAKPYLDSPKSERDKS